MMSNKNNINNNQHLKEPPLKAAIVEPILEACISEASIAELTCITQGLFSIPYNTLKKYLFYLIEYDIVAYRGQRQVYVITYNGLNLLFELKREKMVV